MISQETWRKFLRVSEPIGPIIVVDEDHGYHMILYKMRPKDRKTILHMFGEEFPLEPISGEMRISDN